MAMACSCRLSFSDPSTDYRWLNPAWRGKKEHDRSNGNQWHGRTVVIDLREDSGTYMRVQATAAHSARRNPWGTRAAETRPGSMHAREKAEGAAQAHRRRRRRTVLQSVRCCRPWPAGRQDEDEPAGRPARSGHRAETETRRKGVCCARRGAAFNGLAAASHAGADRNCHRPAARA